MGTLIVTLNMKKQDFSVDIEVPDMLKVDELKRDIVETLRGYRKVLTIPDEGVELYCVRLERIINSHETLAQAGVWNGDYITFVRKRRN